MTGRWRKLSWRVTLAMALVTAAAMPFGCKSAQAQQEPVADAACMPPTLPLGGRQINVYPEDSTGDRFNFAKDEASRKKVEQTMNTYLGIERAFAAAQPGDTLVLHRGTYKITTPIRLDKSGEPGKYIRFLGGMDGDTIIEGGQTPTVFDLGDSRYLWFEGLALNGGGTQFAASQGASNVVIRRCTMSGVGAAIATLQAGDGWHVADNVIQGKDQTGKGVHLAGQDNTVCFNRLSNLEEGVRLEGAGRVLNNEFIGCATALAGTAADAKPNRIIEAQAAPAVEGMSYGPRSFNVVVPRDLITDAPTIENLGFRWYIDGDENCNAEVQVAFRRKGADAWKDALPMLRVQNEVVEFNYPGQNAFLCGNLFAGSVLFLEPGTDYEVRFTMTDPDGGAPAEPPVVTVATRPVPKRFEGGRTLHVYPEGHTGAREANAYSGLMAAYEAAQPGDILLFHVGVYQTDQGYRLTKSGEPGKPIAFVGGVDGEAVIQAIGDSVTHFTIDGTDHLWFERLTLKDANITLAAGRARDDKGASGITMVRCRVLNSKWGVSTASANSRNWYLADNEVVGHWDSWLPFRTTSYSGLRVYGQGHVLCHNRVGLTGDAINIYQGVRPSPDILKQCVSIDIYNNDMYDCMDNHTETDGACHNVRVYRNRMRNAHDSLSAQPTYGGPIYFIRNEIYNNTVNGWKLNRNPAGCVLYNNTTCVTSGCSPTPSARNAAAACRTHARRGRGLRQCSRR